MSNTNMPPFLSGLELSRRLYIEVVRPLLEEAAPGIPHSAARLGSGSDVLGFDTTGPAGTADHSTAHSTDDHSADRARTLRLQLFLHRHDVPRNAGRIRHVLAEHLPDTFHGRPVRGGVEVTHTAPWFTATLGFDPSHITPQDWLAAPTQLLAEVTGGAVFHDGLGELARARAALRWYPHDIWLHVLACQWQRVSREEALVGRCGEVGDEIGSAVAAARLVRDLMRLCLLMDRRYPPYGKWLGTAFAHTSAGHRLTPVLTAAVTAGDRHGREKHLAHAYETVAGLHNQLGLTDRVEPTAPPHRFTRALTSRIADPALKRLQLVGSVDQFVDSAEVLTRPELARAVYASVTSA
ncbi:DUF4037 domain-containing protein [Streptomyces pseudovenezuelae]|uniref:DUF4037 domain-containing protein n=1 Tax=Streptomyces pseudovenezuelae TaxID=67350 RepID=A0ABT6LQ52_9ACTN|nr:DUF4037 domain-containing protein [Streptomyces pseudovenezuelae]MDH6218445.1 hypothetical protein [Streptomyces pseudovenezuelae]